VIPTLSELQTILTKTYNKCHIYLCALAVLTGRIYTEIE